MVREHVPVANYLDFLVALDNHLAKSSLGYVIYGHELYGIAQQAGLVVGSDMSSARWAGECVGFGYVEHGPLSLGDPRPLTPPMMWSQDDLSRVSDYRITFNGRTEADRVRRQRREELTDATLGGVFSPQLEGALSAPQYRALSVPLVSLRSALDAERYSSAVGAAKDLAEAACKLAIERAGGTAPRNADLPVLFKQTLGLTGIEKADGDVGRSLAATVQRLGELRNAVGSGHGRASQPNVTARCARLAAAAACSITAFVLSE